MDQDRTKLITWKDFFTANDAMIEKIKKQIKQSDLEFDYILTMPCGGLMPSYYVAKELGIPVRTINVTSYKDGKRNELQLWEGDKELEINNPERVLVVDDIFDSGNTIKFIQNKFPGIRAACSYARHQDHSLDFVGEILGYENYIDFPFEVRFDGESQKPTVG